MRQFIGLKRIKVKGERLKVKGEGLKVEKKDGEKVRKWEKAELSILGNYNYWITNENT